MPPSRTSVPKVAVIGGGIAGLTAAYTLQKRGVAVEVFEREDVSGGRMRSERHGDYVIERGAQFIASFYKNMRALAAELEIADRIEKLGDARNAVLRNGQFVMSEYGGLKSIGKSRDLALRSKLRLPLMIWPLWHHRQLLDFYHPEKAAKLDDESAAAYTKRLFGQDALDYLVEPAFAGTFTVLPENMSKAFMLSTIATLFKGFRLLSFRGGNGILTQTLADRVPVHLGASVTAVDPSRAGVMVRVEGSRARRFDAVVVAVPGNAVTGIVRGLTDSERTFFHGVRYASSIIAFVMAGAGALPPFYGAGMPRREGVRLYGMAVENSKAGVVPAGKTLFNCAFSEELAAGLMEAPDAAVTDALRIELQKLPLRGLDTVEGIVIHRWPSLVPQFYPGYHRAVRSFLRRPRPTPRLHFAGDYLIGPYTEAALTSGLRAAKACAETLGLPAESA